MSLDKLLDGLGTQLAKVGPAVRAEVEAAARPLRAEVAARRAELAAVRQEAPAPTALREEVAPRRVLRS